jgi:pyruvate,orthophosphate dikinase
VLYAKQAVAFGAEGIGLCRTGHMFLAGDRLPHMQAMILAHNEADRRALKQLLPMRRAEFAGLFEAMNGLPVTIRLLHPPLQELLPKREELLVHVARLEISHPRSPS